MALQIGMGVSRLIFIVGAGYTGTILIKNNKLSEILGELQNLVKGLESSGDSANADSDPIAAQVRWLAQEVRQLANTRQITVLNGSSSQTEFSSLILPAVTLGALGYGYMWWNGHSFSGLMYVTKQSMAVAVESLKANLQGIYAAIEKTKKHLLQGIRNLDDKIEDTREMQKKTFNSVQEVRKDCKEAINKIDDISETLWQLENRMDVFEETQNATLKGVYFLVQIADGKSTEAPRYAQEFRSAVRRLAASGNLGLQCLLSTIEDKSQDAHQLKNFMRSTLVQAADVNKSGHLSLIL